eukprot:8114311-Pyramimonas_sp.AAC.1
MHLALRGFVCLGFRSGGGQEGVRRGSGGGQEGVSVASPQARPSCPFVPISALIGLSAPGSCRFAFSGVCVRRALRFRGVERTLAVIGTGGP